MGSVTDWIQLDRVVEKYKGGRVELHWLSISSIDKLTMKFSTLTSLLVVASLVSLAQAQDNLQVAQHKSALENNCNSATKDFVAALKSLDASQVSDGAVALLEACALNQEASMLTVAFVNDKLGQAGITDALSSFVSNPAVKMVVSQIG